MLNGSDLVFSTSIVWGWQELDTKKVDFEFTLVLLKNITIASAAAVASSRREAFESARPVRSDTMVW